MTMTDPESGLNVGTVEQSLFESDTIIKLQTSA